jgi:hypothetical protein
MKFLVTGTYLSLKRKKTIRLCHCSKFLVSKWAIVRSCRSFGQRARCLHHIWTASAPQPGDQRPTGFLYVLNSLLSQSVPYAPQYPMFGRNRIGIAYAHPTPSLSRCSVDAVRVHLFLFLQKTLSHTVHAAFPCKCCPRPRCPAAALFWAAACS